MKNIIIYSHMGQFLHTDGGTIVQYELARILKENNINVKIYSSRHIINPIFNDFYKYDFPVDESTIVIYCEGTTGNPLNAKRVVRWMLSPLGTNVPTSHLYTWNKNELVYYYNSELKMYDNENKIKNPSIHKLLRSIYIPEIVKQTNFNQRIGTCHAFRKIHFHTGGFTTFHQQDSIELDRHNSMEQYISCFNKCEMFVCYDPLTFYIFIAPMCGCITIVCKVKGVNKQQWINTLGVTEYLNDKKLDNLYGVAYGEDDIEYAKNTLHLAREQWNDIIQHCKYKTIIPFIKDIDNLDNFETLQNTIANNYYN